MMKPLSIALIGLAALTASASARSPSMPSEFKGNWCGDATEASEAYAGSYQSPENAEGRKCVPFKVVESGFGNEDMCSVVSVGRVKKEVAPSGATFTVTLKARCTVESDEPYIQGFEFMRYKGNLWVKHLGKAKRAK